MKVSAKSLRKAEIVRLDGATYAALRRYARRRQARSLSAAARLALRSFLSGEPAPTFSAQTSRSPRVRALRLQLEPELRARLSARNLGATAALQAYLGDRTG